MRVVRLSLCFGLSALFLLGAGTARPQSVVTTPTSPAPSPTTPPPVSIPPSPNPTGENGAGQAQGPAPTPTTSPPIPAPSLGAVAPDLGAGRAFIGEPTADPNTSVILDQADSLEETTPGHWTARGNVQVRYKGYTLTADRADADLDAGEVLFSGNVVVLAPNGQKAEGGKTGTLRLNLRRDTYTIFGARSTVGPQSLNLGIILPLFIYGGVITGQPGLIDARGSSFTTCDFLDPHYYFQARQVYVLPGRRLVGKNVSLYRKNKRILTLPYFFVPLDRRFSRQTLVPQVGQTPDEGVFIKYAFGYALADSLPGILRLDAMQKKGLGTGFEQNYGSPNAPNKPRGLFSLYRLYDTGRKLENLTGSLNHQQTFGTVALSLNSQFQRNSYFAGTGSSRGQNTQINLTRSVGNLDTALRTSLSSNDYGAGRSQTLTTAFDQTFRPTRAEQLVTRFDFSQFTSPTVAGLGGASDRRQLESNLDYTQRGHLFDLELLGTAFTQLGHSTTGSTFFSGTERLPELRLASDVLRVTGLRTFLPASTRFDLSLGEFNEAFSHTRTERARFNLDLGSNTRHLDARNSLDYGGSFQQGFYGDDTAQYVLNGRAGYRLRIGSKSSAGVSYLYLRPYGFTPFQFDFTGSSNLSSLFFSYQETRQFQLSLSTGYDFNRAHGGNGIAALPWQNLSVRSLFAPNPSFGLRTTASYDLNRNTLLDLTNYLRVRGAYGTALDLSSRYAPQQHKFSNIYGNLNLPLTYDPHEDAGYRLRAIGGYNGFTRRFEYKGLALTRAWHDWEATLIYQDDPTGLRPGSGLTFNFRLKAFPAFEPFATGQLGQSFDTGLGEVY